MTRTQVRIEIITCPQWGAVWAKTSPTVIGKAPGIMFHHTAGHHPEIAGPHNESVAEAKAYARAIQRMHMAPGGLGTTEGGIDSGHNFLVTRSGLVLQGRWGTVRAIEAGEMVLSAHCPGFNNWVGVEHEHDGTEKMPPAQFEASARLQAWIASCYGRTVALPVQPHSAHFATACPGTLRFEVEPIRHRAQAILSAAAV